MFTMVVILLIANSVNVKLAVLQHNQNFFSELILQYTCYSDIILEEYRDFSFLLICEINCFYLSNKYHIDFSLMLPAGKHLPTFVLKKTAFFYYKYLSCNMRLQASIFLYQLPRVEKKVDRTEMIFFHMTNFDFSRFLQRSKNWIHCNANQVLQHDPPICLTGSFRVNIPVWSILGTDLMIECESVLLLFVCILIFCKQ